MTDRPFAVEAEIVKHATGLPGAIAAGLSLAGGILRCGTCGGERPADDITGYLRDGWPSHCGHVMTWVTLKEVAAENWGEIPAGYELTAVRNGDWRIETGQHCRRQGARSKACGEPSVASLNRPRLMRATAYRPEQRVDSWWSYCLSHLYGNWIENQQVMHWVLREKGTADAPRP